MLFDIINPSNAYTIEAPDLELAAVAICLIGEGKYALNELSGDKSGHVPAFLIGGHDEWFQKQFDRDFGASVAAVTGTPARREQLVKALASVHIGGAADRREFNEKAGQCATAEEVHALLYEMHDAKRSSANDIGRRAWGLGMAVLEAGAMEGAA